MVMSKPAWPSQRRPDIQQTIEMECPSSTGRRVVREDDAYLG